MVVYIRFIYTMSKLYVASSVPASGYFIITPPLHPVVQDEASHKFVEENHERRSGLVLARRHASGKLQQVRQGAFSLVVCGAGLSYPRQGARR